MVGTMGQDTAFAGRADDMVPGVAAPLRPEVGEVPEIAVERVSQKATRSERERKMREELGYNTEQVNAMEAARGEAIEELKLVEKQIAEGQAFYEVLPEREGVFMSMQEADNMAKASALTSTRRLLYDMQKRSNFSDMMRNIFPFAEAWWEIVTTWSRLVQDNPRTLQRFQQAY